MARKKLISVSSNYDDVWDTIEDLVAKNKNVSEYACKAIRFYEKYKDSLNQEITEHRIREIFKEEFEKHLAKLNLQPKDEGKLKIDDVLKDKDFQDAFDSFENNLENIQ